MDAARCSGLVVGLFAAALAAPGVDLVLRPDSARAPTGEQRKRTAMPRLGTTLYDVLTFPERFESHFEDSFGWRDKLLRWHSLRQLELFGLHPAPNLYAGLDGWWYYSGENSIPLQRGVKPFAPHELEAWRNAIAAQSRWCRERGLEFVFVIVPNKETIYPEHVPPRYARLGPSRLDQLRARLAGEPELGLLDLQPAFEAAKAEDGPGDYVYFPLGTHWTTRGAWVAYREILRRIQARFPALVPIERGDLVAQPMTDEGDSWAERAYVGDVYLVHPVGYGPRAGWSSETVRFETQPWTTHWRARPGPGLPRMVFFHDSFGALVDVFLAESCSSLVQTHRYGLDAALIAESGAEVVVAVYVERHLGDAPPALVLPQDADRNARAFRASQEVLYRFDPAREPPEVEARAGTRLARRAAPEPALEISTFTAADTFLLPELPYPSAGGGLLFLEIESPAAQTLDVLFLRRGFHEYHRNSNLEVPLVRGHNALHLRLEDPDMTGRLCVRPRAVGTLVLRALELRAPPR